ncbi:MAG: DUF2703 domain-containing protein [Candidatus Thermoplasmatota archaeon]|nr:DUF2703 domain-containing protein [Candidatus Thermoplasmatota archaeon]
MEKMKAVTIEWQRLVIDERKTTCPRCGSTEKSLDLAIQELKRLGIEAKLKKKTLSLAQFSKIPTESNRILINGRPLEYWLGAKTGKSACCSVCGDSECRTIELGKKVYETIPADLIVRACVKAAQKEKEEK